MAVTSTPHPRLWWNPLRTLWTVAVFGVALYAGLFLLVNGPAGRWAVGVVLTELLDGQVRFGTFRVAPAFDVVHLEDIHLRDPWGRSAIRLEALTCRLDPVSLARRARYFERCRIAGGRVLVMEEADGFINLELLFAGRWGQSRPSTPGRWRLRFPHIDIDDVDVLIVVEGMELRFDQVSAREVELLIASNQFSLRAPEVRFQRGVARLSEDLFALGSGYPSWEEVARVVSLEEDPWREDTRQPRFWESGQRGWVTLDLEDGVFSEFVWLDYVLGWRRVDVLVERMPLVASGGLRFIAGAVKVPPRERPGLMFGGALRLQPHVRGVRAWSYFLPGLIEEIPDVEGGTRWAPIEIDAHGTLRFVEARARLGFEQLVLLGWPVARAKIGLALEGGRLRLGADSVVEAWGGRVTAWGEKVPLEGLWSLHLCLDGVYLDQLLAPFVDDVGSLQSVDSLRLFTAERSCVPGLRSGLHLFGDLTRKGLGRSIAASTPRERLVQAPMLELCAQGLEAAWRTPPGGLPLGTLRARVDGALTQRGDFVFESRGACLPADEPWGITATNGPDRLRALLSFSTLDGSIVEGRWDLRVDALGPWLPGDASSSPIRTWSAQAAGDLVGPLLEPYVQTLRLSVSGPGDARAPLFSEAQWRSLWRGDRQGLTLVQPSTLRTAALTLDISSGGRVELFDGSLWALRDVPDLALQGRLQRLELDAATLPEGIAASLRGDWAFAYRDGRADAALDIETGHATLFGQPFRDAAGSVAWRWEAEGPSAGTTQLDALRATLAGGCVGVQGSIAGAADNLLLRVWGRGIDLEALRWTAADAARAASREAALEDPWSSERCAPETIGASDPALGRTGGATPARAGGGDLLQGQLSVDGWLRRGRTGPALRATLQVDDARVAGVVLPWWSAVVDMSERQEVSGLWLELLSLLDDQRDLRVSYRVDQGYIEADLALTGVDVLSLVRDIASWTSGEVSDDLRSELRVTLDGVLRVRVWLEPEVRVQAALQVDGLTVDLAAERLVTLTSATPGQVVVVRWSWEGGQDALEISPFALRHGADALVVRACGWAHERVHCAIRGRAPLTLLRLLPELIADADGAADVVVDIAGSLERPQVSGRVEIANAQVTPRGLGATIALRRALVELYPDRYVLPEAAPLTGRVFDGDLVVHGTIYHERLAPRATSLRAFFNGLTYRMPDELTLVLQADTTFTAEDLFELIGLRVTGQVEVLEARYYRNFDLLAEQLSFGELGRTAARFSLPVWQRVPVLGALETDVMIRGRDRFFVESRVATAALQLELQTDLRLTGRLDAMDLRGEVTLLDRSQVSYSGRLFDVERGVLRFDGFRDAEGFPWPVLDAELVSLLRPCRSASGVAGSESDFGLRVREQDDVIRLTANIEGRLPTQMLFRLESAPFFDQRDLLSLVLTGCTLDELTAASAGSPTLDLLFRPVLQTVERNLEEQLRVDDVELVPSADGSVEVVVRDEVTERLQWSLQARVGSDGEGAQLLRAQYRVMDFFLLEALEQSRGRDAVTLEAGMRFRVRFR